MSSRNQNASSATRITSATSTQVKGGPGTLRRIIVAVPVSGGTITIVDNTSGSTATHGVITSTADLKPFVIECGFKMSTGIRIVTTEAQDVVVVWD